MRKHGRYLKKTGKKTLGWKKIMLIVPAVLAVLIAAAAIAAAAYLNSMLNLIVRPDSTERDLSEEELQAILNYNPDATETAAAPETTEPEETTEAPETLPPYTASGLDIINILLIGQDSREGEEHKLSDSMILCSINKKTCTLTMTSFQRDMYVQLPNYKTYKCGKNRINVAYALGWAWGGTEGAMYMLDECIRMNFGVEVDYNAEVDFEAFTEVINVLGGVDIELTEAEAEYMTDEPKAGGGTFAPGLNHMEGDAALVYARLRKIDANGDFARTNRQRTVIANLVDKCRSMSFSQLHALATTVLPLIITDMTNDEITACICEVLPLLPELKIESGQCPADGTYYGQMVEIGGYPSSVLIPNVEANKKILMEIAEGVESPG